MLEKESESGFTLIEILVVIGIIAILAAIAVPVFMNQRKASAQAAVESDLKNAALVLEDEMVGNDGKYIPYVPNYDNRSEGVSVVLNKALSSKNKFCLVGKSLTYPDLVFSYDSQQGGMLPKGQSCTPPDGTSGNESFATVLAGKKALIVHGAGGHDVLIRDYLITKYGLGTVDIMANPAPSAYEGYDVIIAAARVWNLPPEVYANVAAGYNNGANIITDGNDNSAYYMPKMVAVTETRTSGSAYFHQTGNTGLSPAFPYTFKHTSFPNDSWQCVTSATTGTVVIADSPDPLDTTKKCLTALGVSSSNGGQWTHLNFMPVAGETGMTDAVLNWMLY